MGRTVGKNRLKERQMKDLQGQMELFADETETQVSTGLPELGKGIDP